MKPRILVFPFGLMSHYLRSAALLRPLLPHAEIYFAASHRYSERIEAEGYRTFPCSDLDAEEVIAESTKFSFSWLNEAQLEKVLLSQVAAIEQLRPDFVVGDNSFTLKMAAEKTGVPMVSVMNAYMSRHYGHYRKMTRLHPKTAQMERLPAAWYRLIVKWAEQYHMNKVHRPYRALRKKYGLKKVAGYSAEFEGDLNLICDAPEIFPLKKLPGNVAVIGPLLYRQGFVDDGLLGRITPDKKTILVSMGSSGSFEKLLALNDSVFAKYRIVTAGDSENILNAPHVWNAGFVHFASLADKADLIICHAGNGTVYHALEQGVPVLCATHIFEQEWNEQRLVELGLGASIGDFSAAGLEHLIRSWISKKGQPAWADIARKLQAYQAPETAMAVLRQQGFLKQPKD